MQRAGGPAGYLLELCRAASSAPAAAHEVLFPPQASPSEPHRRKSLRTMVGRWKRSLVGRPRFDRPSASELGRRGGVVSELLTRSAHLSREACRASLDQLAHFPPEIVFAHDLQAVEMLRERRHGAEVWLMTHSPMPMALYLAWTWACPERCWKEVAELPDVREGIDRELEIWGRVDRIVLPCPEALEELARVDPRFRRMATSIDFVLSGSTVAAPTGGTEAELTGSSSDECSGLYLGSGQPYRGLDVLLEAVRMLPSRKELPGVVAIAGPDPESLPSHPRLKKLGRVEDVPALLTKVDFIVNTNRFSLFDLSNIEATAAGKPLLLHAVGGNNALARLGAGCRSFSDLTPRTVSSELAAMFSMGREELSVLGRRSRGCYEEHLTAESMWRRHLELYDRASRPSPAGAAGRA